VQNEGREDHSNSSELRDEARERDFESNAKQDEHPVRGILTLSGAAMRLDAPKVKKFTSN
jgi:hypothetical protein